MDHAWFKAILTDDRLSTATPRVAYALQDRANDQRVTWPTLGTIAAEAGVSKRTAQDAIKQLVECGYIWKKGIKEGDRLSNGYVASRTSILYTIIVKQAEVCVTSEEVAKSATPPRQNLPHPRAKFATKSLPDPSHYNKKQLSTDNVKTSNNKSKLYKQTYDLLLKTKFTTKDGPVTIAEATRSPEMLCTTLTSYPLDIVDPVEITLAANWTAVNPPRSKKGLARFLNNWYSRALKYYSERKKKEAKHTMPYHRILNADQLKGGK